MRDEDTRSSQNSLGLTRRREAAKENQERQTARLSTDYRGVFDVSCGKAML